MIEISATSFCRATKSFGKHEVLRGIDLTVAEHEVVALIGASGSGKSTLLRCINGLVPIQSGTIRVAAFDVHALRTDKERIALRKEVSMVFQQYNLFPHLTVLENCMLALMKVRGVGKAQAKDTAMKYLARVRIPDQAGKYPAQLSGGQQQRVAIARALINQPSILLADEPTGNLDTKTSIEVMDIFQRLNREHNITVVLITHERDIAEYGTRIVSFRDGQVISDTAVAHRRLAQDELLALPAESLT